MLANASIAANSLFKSEEYVLLPPKYGESLKLPATYHYYRTDGSKDALVTCTLLDKGIPQNDKTIQVPISVVEARKVKKGETYTQVGKYTYRYCILKIHDGAASYVFKYGQVLQTEWQQNLVFESIDAHAKLQVRIMPGNTIVVAKPKDVLLCTQTCFLCRPLENASASAFNNTEVRRLHRQIDSAVFATIPADFLSAYASSGKSKREIRWLDNIIVFTTMGTTLAVSLKSNIDELRQKRNLPPWKTQSSTHQTCAIKSASNNANSLSPKQAAEIITLQFQRYLDQFKHLMLQLQESAKQAQHRIHLHSSNSAVAEESLATESLAKESIATEFIATESIATESLAKESVAKESISE